MSNEANKPIDPPHPDNIRAWHPELSYGLACAVRYELQDLIWRGKLRCESDVIDAVPELLARWAKECTAATRNGPMWSDQSAASTNRLQDVSRDAPGDRQIDRVKTAMLAWADELDAAGNTVAPFIAAEVRRRVELAERPDVTSGVGAVGGPGNGPSTILQGTVSGIGTAGVEVG